MPFGPAGAGVVYISGSFEQCKPAFFGAAYRRTR
jgi:hypothetical protein